MKPLLLLLAGVGAAGCIKNNTCEAQYRASYAAYVSHGQAGHCPPYAKPPEKNDLPVLADPH